MMTRTNQFLRDFLRAESAGGIALMLAAAMALVTANSPFAAEYFRLLDIPLTVAFGGAAINKPLLLWINDGLMALFFFLIGLEVKREMLCGQLASWRQASLPLFAAIGGMVVPAAIFIAINIEEPANIAGWAIPAATDIAFALGILALLGKHVPVVLKALLLAIAVIDDIGAIAIIALFYSNGVAWPLLGAAAVILTLMALLGSVGVGRNWPYVVLGLVLWVLVLKSGVHATLAGVAAALTIPMKSGTQRPLERMEHALHPWVAFLVVPIFAFANAGVSFSGVDLTSLAEPLPLGIAAGLVIGKQLGILGFAWAAVKTGIASIPDEISWRQFHGLSLIAGIGFTMSLFIGNLAFHAPQQVAAVKLGVLSGSLLAALAGILLLRHAAGARRSAQ